MLLLPETGRNLMRLYVLPSRKGLWLPGLAMLASSGGLLYLATALSGLEAWLVGLLAIPLLFTGFIYAVTKSETRTSMAAVYAGYSKGQLRTLGLVELAIALVLLGVGFFINS